jgi:adenine-specific DNA-methyltransferase
MEYVENTTIERLKKVIAGEQGGISKSVDWQGGGSFTYCRLILRLLWYLLVQFYL